MHFRALLEPCKNSTSDVLLHALCIEQGLSLNRKGNHPAIPPASPSDFLPGGGLSPLL